MRGGRGSGWAVGGSRSRGESPSMRREGRLASGEGVPAVAFDGKGRRGRREMMEAGEGGGGGGAARGGEELLRPRRMLSAPLEVISSDEDNCDQSV